jgi:macrolide transport system ATP-binding/permease protein
VIDNLSTDIRHSVRRLQRSPSFAITAVAILAIGIGATTAVFSVVNTVLLQPLPYAQPERIYSVMEIIPELVSQYPEVPANARHYLEWRSCECFDDLAMIDNQDWNLAGDGEPERVAGARVTTNLFGVLGVPAQLGRTFAAADEEDERVALISDALWRRRFGGSPDAIGQSLVIDGQPHLVVGVLPAGFRNHLKRQGFETAEKRIDVYKPWRVDAEGVGWVGDHNYPVVARLAAGKTVEQALAEFNALQAALTQNFEGPDRAFTLRGALTPLKEQVVARGRVGLWLLLAAVGAVLLIGCLNLGNLILVRALARGRETAIRAALGAGRGRILRAALIESLLIACTGAALGAAVAFNVVRVFASRAPAGLPRVDEIGMNSEALAFSMLLAVASAAAFGLVPALRLMRTDPQDSLRGSGRATEGAEPSRLRDWFVAAQVGLSTALLIVAGLLISSFMRVGAVERGYDAANVLTAEVSLPAGVYPDRDARRRFYDDLVERLESRPEVSDAGVASVLPLKGDAWADFVTVDGDDRPLGQRPIMGYRTVSPDYLAALGIALYSGRSMQQSDFPRRVAVVSRSAAESLWPGESAIGKQFRRGVPTEPAFEVIGVADDVRAAGLDRVPPPLVYVALWERSPEAGAIAIRATLPPALAYDLLRESVRAIDPTIPISNVATMAQIESDSTAQRRFQTLLVGAFAGAALLLAAIGIYGVVSYSIALRTNEIGLRIALGAQPQQVRAMIVRAGLRPIAIGLVAGVVAALALGRLVAALLFGTEATDPVTFVSVTCIIAAVALAASWVPARRAAGIAPLTALRHE